MQLDESELELLVLDSIRAATNISKRIFARRRNDFLNEEAAQSKMLGLTKAEEIGIFVTALRSELITRSDKLPHHLKASYEDAKLFLIKTENWVAVGQLGTPAFVWETKSSGRAVRRRQFSRPGFDDIEDINKLIQSKKLTITGGDMDRTRIGQIAQQAAQQDGFDFQLSFKTMDELLRNMNLMARRQEMLSVEATQVTEKLCEVAETLAVAQ